MPQCFGVTLIRKADVIRMTVLRITSANKKFTQTATPQRDAITGVPDITIVPITRKIVNNVV